MYSGLSANEWILQDGELAEQLTPAELPCSPVNSPFLESLLEWNENPQRVHAGFLYPSTYFEMLL